jgi:hypothetical protein
MRLGLQNLAYWLSCSVFCQQKFENFSPRRLGLIGREDMSCIFQDSRTGLRIPQPHEIVVPRTGLRIPRSASITVESMLRVPEPRITPPLTVAAMDPATVRNLREADFNSEAPTIHWKTPPVVRPKQKPRPLHQPWMADLLGLRSPAPNVDLASQTGLRVKLPATPDRFHAQ